MTAEQFQLLSGSQGFDVITDTALHTPLAFKWFALQVLADAVIATANVDNCSLNGTDNSAALATVALSAGTILFGTWRSVTLTSGKVAMLKIRKD